jgi:hypothetical protein
VRARLDAPLQVGIRLLQPIGHQVKLFGQRLQLVTGANVDAVI